jgi:hypothetical protein
MQRYTTPHLENKAREAFQWGSGGWEAEACTPPEAAIAQIFVGVVFDIRKRTGNQHFPDDFSITGSIPINQSILFGTGCVCFYSIEI